jgi:hypothetical protein
MIFTIKQQLEDERRRHKKELKELKEFVRQLAEKESNLQKTSLINHLDSMLMASNIHDGLIVESIQKTLAKLGVNEKTKQIDDINLQRHVNLSCLDSRVEKIWNHNKILMKTANNLAASFSTLIRVIQNISLEQNLLALNENDTGDFPIVTGDIRSLSGGINDTYSHLSNYSQLESPNKVVDESEYFAIQARDNYKINVKDLYATEGTVRHVVASVDCFC